MEPPSSRHVTVLNQSDRTVPDHLLGHAVSVALRQHGLDGAEVCLLLTGDSEVQDLNRRFRNLDEPTDVLTFPSGDLPPEPLGDIAISVPYAERQAQKRGVSVEEELAFLAIHGALHLAGLDDETESDRAHMVLEMNRAALEVGLPPDDAWASILHGEAR